MKFPTKLLLSAAAVAMAVAAPVAQAGALGGYLTPDGPVHLTFPVTPGGGEDKLQDDSVSAFVDKNPTSPTFGVGDQVWGLMTFSDIEASGKPSVGVTSHFITVLYSAEIKSLSGPDGKIVLGATSAGATSLASLCGALCTGKLSANSIGVVLATSNTANTNDPLNYSTTNTTTNLNTAANGWAWEATMGLVETDDFFHFDGSLFLGGTERGAFTIEQSIYAWDWAPVDVFDFASNTHVGDVTLDVGSVQLAQATVPPGSTVASQKDRGWTFRDQASVFVNPIPEPSSLFLLGAGLLGFAGSRRRQK